MALISSFIMESCCTGGDIAYDFTELNDFTFTISYKQFSNLYDTHNTLANVDSFKVLNELGDEVILTRFTQNADYYFSAKSIYDQSTDPNPLSSSVCKRYFFYHNYQDNDTLDICFTAKETKCRNRLSTFTAAYNNVKIQDIAISSNGAKFNIHKE